MRPTIITPPGRLALPPWRELWEAREVAMRFGQRDIVLRYRQTLIGVAWVLIQPLASAGIFAIVFGAVAKLPSGGVPYFLFSYMSMLAWTLFASTVSRAAPSLVANQALVSKVFFPRMLMPVSTAASTLLDFGVGFALGVILLFIYRVNPGWPVLLVPVWVVIFVAVALGIGLAASAWMVKYRDVQYILPWVLQVALYATPVAYATDAVPANLRPLFLANPLAWMLDGFRWSVLGTAMPPAWQLIGSAVVAVLVLLLGATTFQRYERSFADLI
ncbi:ABC transporter permease [Microbacterium rhizosphaerae]|uniref:Transport permease protein n=1 Tax=Microbacterium rhizosphaerae TaxID=1678237 RepID=A0ABZ0SLB1_9MICO|nr:ABC transporter permease [Microbacterium rhizosphaerae]WPR89754.1 ABC transporter permease [Microbacterium rhizosphaerae]